MTMLIFTAPLTRQFRFVSIVTILQQTAPAFVENENDMERRRHDRCKMARGERRVTACQRVGQTLALFRYYTEV
jgi:hypothetical protein